MKTEFDWEVRWIWCSGDEWEKGLESARRRLSDFVGLGIWHGRGIEAGGASSTRSNVHHVHVLFEG